MLALVLPLLAGCATLDRDANADGIAGPVGLKRMIVKTDPFVLTTFARIRDPGQPVTVYIEGDGLAWLSRSEVSLDPTPREAMGLALAAADPSPNVVYLARPCQFTARAKNPTCGIPYWTGKRFAPEVIAAMGQAVDQVAAQVPGQKINLVGYSGGGAVAVLVAAGRKDVASIRTVAGNLDHAEVNRLAKVSPLSGSLNTIDVAPQVAKIPQIHFSGAVDTTVPPVIAERFRQAAGSSCVVVRTVPGASHETGWRERWRELLREVPGCV
ncbi:esterase/lipase/thioesterase [Paramagnetospirillum caucaseum]|uniref:Esterase/lipase/thioesterase n=1 Tax=Paramagnetospirillum caucaseum TaxID=1244869 RepID=M3A983_9PROT|nr:esterase/lipase/thioesterase [Paramagnetospirillum caucaseum]EME69054.1 esterase/lipase/thioesterase [Paramagnetospirillum caucaseum]